MSSKILSNIRNKKLTLVVVTLFFGILLAPRDPAIFSGPAGNFILPAMASGIAFGMAIMLLIDLVRGFGDKAKTASETKQEGA